MILNIIFKFWAILLAIFCAVIFTYNVIEPKFNEMCLIKTNECISITYKKVGNSLLINVNPEDYWMWYDGKYLLVYNLTTNKKCKSLGDEEFEEVFVYNPKERKVMNFLCGRKLSELQNEYKEQTSKTLYYRINLHDMDIYNVIEILEKKYFTIIKMANNIKVFQKKVLLTLFLDMEIALILIQRV